MAESGDVRTRLLRAVWREIRTGANENVLSSPAARRAVEDGASLADVSQAIDAARYEIAFRLLFLLAAEHTEEGDYDARLGWTLAEADVLEDGTAVPNGNPSLDFIHEDLLGADPTGREGQDLFT